jgi:DNA-binding FrmR family transcriptional regulator
MKPHEPKNRAKTRAKRKGGKQRAIKNQIEKGEKAIKR